MYFHSCNQKIFSTCTVKEVFMLRMDSPLSWIKRENLSRIMGNPRTNLLNTANWIQNAPFLLDFSFSFVEYVKCNQTQLVLLGNRLRTDVTYEKYFRCLRIFMCQSLQRAWREQKKKKNRKFYRNKWFEFEFEFFPPFFGGKKIKLKMESYLKIWCAQHRRRWMNGLNKCDE